MIEVIIGKQNSGKSLRAEETAVSYGSPLFYLATMKVMDDEGRKRVEKHRKQRDGKGFITIECPFNIRQAVDVIRDLAKGSADRSAKDPAASSLPYASAHDKKSTRDEMRPDDIIQATVLLECVANLVGNELYDNPDRPWSHDPMRVDADEFAGTVLDDIRFLADKVNNLVIVSSEYEIDESEDIETKKYISLLNIVNMRLTLMGEPE